MYILGVSCFYHDAAAALIEDGVLVAAAEEERFSRKKHDYGFPQSAIEFCLRKAGITADDLDYVVFYEKPLVKFERILMTSLGTFPRSWETFGEAMISWFDQKLWIKNLLMDKVGIPEEKLLFTDHHLSHAASALFCSPYDEAAIITVDGVGEWATATIGRGKATWDGRRENSITLFQEQRFPHSLGLLYSAFTAFLGFKVNNGEYKVMGMAPYGQPRYEDKVRKLIDIKDDGSFRLMMDYFCYHYSPTRTFNSKFEALFGSPRDPKSEFITRLTDLSETVSEADLERNQHYADVAASIQGVTEKVLLKMASYAYQETGLKKLCLAGGVALNSVANGRILRETPFEELYIQPAAGDSGGAVGAALYAYHVLLQKPRRFVMEHAYWGEEYSEAQVKEYLDSNGIRYEYVEDDERLVEMMVDDLLKGKVVGWFQGRFEWGPRALGNRSILADPRRADMKNIVNTKIKFREPFRPFAPVVLEERTEEFFELSDAARHYPARYMLMVVPVREEKQSAIPAVTHQGGTGRLQTVRRDLNPRYYRVVERFGEATGVPVLLNTSFNLRGEPIVNSPADAFNTFSNSGLDVLVLGQFVVRK
ncbi:MAG: carbamoyltransferase [Anaerolineae bacterium]|nr:carbamoyltransferase [Anaerolineae bacterium]